MATRNVRRPNLVTSENTAQETSRILARQSSPKTERIPDAVAALSYGTRTFGLPGAGARTL